MKFPKYLIHNGRQTYSSNLILSYNFMYARFPLAEWKEGDAFPDFARIRSAQSFNWSSFSIPEWTRFNDKKEYKSGYGVIGYSVKTIKKTNLINPKFDNNTFSLIHKPITFNYSHCELVQLKEVTKKNKREIRMTFKHKCIIPIPPGKNRSRLQTLLDYLKMYSHRLHIKFLSLKSKFSNFMYS